MTTSKTIVESLKKFKTESFKNEENYFMLENTFSVDTFKNLGVHLIRKSWSYFSVNLQSLNQAEIKNLMANPSHKNLIAILDLSGIEMTGSEFTTFFGSLYK